VLLNVLIAGSKEFLKNPISVPIMHQILDKELGDNVKTVYVIGGPAFTHFVESYLRKKLILAEVVGVKMKRTHWIRFGTLTYVRECDKVLCFYPLWSVGGKTDAVFYTFYHGVIHSKYCKLFFLFNERYVEVKGEASVVDMVSNPPPIEDS